jgi:hypothetical protein
VDHLDHVKTTLAVMAVYARPARSVPVPIAVWTAVITTVRTAFLLLFIPAAVPKILAAAECLLPAVQPLKPPHANAVVHRLLPGGRARPRLPQLIPAVVIPTGLPKPVVRKAFAQTAVLTSITPAASAVRPVILMKVVIPTQIVIVLLLAPMPKLRNIMVVLPVLPSTVLIQMTVFMLPVRL